VTISQLVEKFGLPVKIKAEHYPAFTVREPIEDGWLVESESGKTHFVSALPALDDYEKVD